MANQPNSKLKLLFLLDILRERTDEEHGLSTQEIIEALAERGIDAARKSVYRDIEVLREAGFDVEVTGEPAPRNQRYERLDPTVRQPWAFGVFNEAPAKLTLRIEPDAMSMVVDKFGPEFESMVSRDGHVRAYVRTIPSHDFFGWLFQVSDKIALESPKHIVEAYKERLAAAMRWFEAS